MSLLPLLVMACVINLSAGGYLRARGQHLVNRHNVRMFLSGANTAWVAYAHDFGNDQYRLHRGRYLELMDKVKNAGGNSMRTWVHVEGESSPHFDHTGHVTGLDSGDGSFLADFKQYLDDAKERNILIFPTLWNGALRQHPGGPLAGLITVPRKLRTYINKALKPWVRAVRNHPALGGWDIINEMEGVIRTDQRSSNTCFDTTFLARSGAGWAGPSYTAQQLLRFINWQAAAIRSIDRTALVTAGSWSPKSQTNQFGNKNLYSDRCLLAAGRKRLGKLTFYSTHSYDWNGRFSQDSTFQKRANDYRLNKPLVIAEFNQRRGGGRSIQQLFNYAYNNGYSGAWSWHAKADGSHTDPTDLQMRGIASIRNKNDRRKGRIRISIR